MTRIKITILSADKKYIKDCSQYLEDTLLANYQLKVFCYNKRSQIYSLLRSPHANKNSQEQFISLKYKAMYFIEISKLMSCSRKRLPIMALKQLSARYMWTSLKAEVEKSTLNFKSSF